MSCFSKFLGKDTSQLAVIKKIFNIYITIGGEIPDEVLTPVVLVSLYVSNIFFSNTTAIFIRGALLYFLFASEDVDRQNNVKPTFRIKDAIFNYVLLYIICAFSEFHVLGFPVRIVLSKLFDNYNSIWFRLEDHQEMLAVLEGR